MASEPDEAIRFYPKFGDGLTAKDAKDAKTDNWE
jgi:hypothetical protein